MIDIALIEILITGVCTIAMWSYLYKENIVFRLFENIFVATASCTALVMAVKYITENAIVPLMKGDILAGIPIVLGLLTFLTYVKRYSHIYRISTAFMVGSGTALSMRRALHLSLYNQVIATIVPIFTTDIVATINNIIILVGFVTAMSYFIFTMTENPLLKKGSKIGRYFLMIGFGAGIGQGFMTRMAYINGRMQLMFRTDAIYLIPIAFAIIIIDVIRKRMRASE